jgi:preprotein translocase SecE subunit
VSVSKTEGWGFDALRPCHFYGHIFLETLVNNFMTNPKHTVIYSRSEKVRWVLFVFFVVAAPAGFYGLGLSGADRFLQWLTFWVSLAVALGFFLTSWTGKKLVSFVREAIQEVGKMVWPDRAQVIRSTLAVITIFLLIALSLWLFDGVLEWFVYTLLLGWKQ